MQLGNKEAIDLATYALYDFNSFLNCFNEELQTWYDKVWKLLEKIRMMFNAPNLTVDWKQVPPDLISVFNGISVGLPDWSVWHGEKITTSVLFIGEVNLLRELMIQDPNGRSIIQSIFTWFVKEERKFHVILASSDNFVHNWLSNLVVNGRFHTFVVGH